MKMLLHLCVLRASNLEPCILQIRQRDIGAARKLLGMALGMCPKAKILQAYIALERQFGCINRCRKLHEKRLTLWPTNVKAWMDFAGLEKSVGEDDRARAIYELAVDQPSLDMPEFAWKCYIDFEIEKGEYDKTRALYERLLARTQHPKVWMSYAAFYASILGDAEAARKIYSRAADHFKTQGDDGKEHRALILETSLAFEQGLVDDDVAQGGDGSQYSKFLKDAESKAPKVVIKRREIHAEGDEAGPVVSYEEYKDYIFPDDDNKPAALKLLDLAQRWKASGGNLKSVLAAGNKRSAGDAGLNTNATVYDPNALDIDDDVDDVGAGDLLASATGAAASVSQTVFAEVGDAEDGARGKEVEREQEDLVRAAATAAEIPRDLYSEEDAGDKADRD
jgi:tetratricopeptide (TPR) repeat protein